MAGTAAVKRDWFIRLFGGTKLFRGIKLFGGTKTVNRVLEAKARDLAGMKGYVIKLAACPDGTLVTAEFVIGASHRLSQIEKAFGMSGHDLQARPVCHHRRDSIEAHPTIVFAALAVSRWIDEATGWPVRKFVRTGTPLPGDRDPRRRTHPYRRRPPARRRQQRPRPHPPALTCALIWPDSGYR